MNVKEIFGNKKALALIVIAVAIVLVYIVSSSAFVAKSVEANIAKTTLSPGEETVLTVKVSNPSSWAMSNVYAEATTSDNDIAIIGPTPSFDVIGKGESRIFKFRVIVLNGAADGTYFIDILVPAVKEQARVGIEVKS